MDDLKDVKLCRLADLNDNHKFSLVCHEEDKGDIVNKILTEYEKIKCLGGESEMPCMSGSNTAKMEIKNNIKCELLHQTQLVNYIQ